MAATTQTPAPVACVPSADATVWLPAPGASVRLAAAHGYGKSCDGARDPRWIAEIVNAHGAAWYAAVLPHCSSHRFHKGFVEQVRVNAEQLVHNGSRLFAVAPVRHLQLRGSLGLPALNEEKTIGEIITILKTSLMQDVPLLDEMVLIDSNSTDRTREIAAELGVPVHIHQEVLPEVGPGRGKGEALWKSLAVTTGELVVWVDTDVSQFHPKFVYGLIGPLLVRPDIAFVKAFYRRPLNVGGELQATGGGRVTELAARPILNLFFPELSGIIQPLSGEQAGRRSLLERLPFFDLYGVETGLLIDILRGAGLKAIAQVDMKQRIHRNQSLLNLSKTSFEILQVAMKRLGDGDGVDRIVVERNGFGGPVEDVDVRKHLGQLVAHARDRLDGDHVRADRPGRQSAGDAGQHLGAGQPAVQ